MKLRAYQEQAVCGLRAACSSSRAVLLTAPTGAGKTVMAGAVIEAAVAKGSSVLFIAHRKELLDQLSTLLDAIGIDHGILKANHWRTDPSKPVQVASIQTLQRRRIFPAADLIVVDEAHGRFAAQLEILHHYPDAVIIGLTATPWRLDKQGLGKIYGAMVEASTPAELCELGYLISPRMFVPSAPDLKGIKRGSGSDYRLPDLAKVMDRGGLIGDIVGHWRELAGDRSTVVFATTIAHSMHVVEQFRAFGIAAEHVDGNMSDHEREGILDRLASGKTQVVSNCDVITEGYDLPQLSCAVLARPTASLSKFLQMVGRIMRPHDCKASAVILDHAGCILKHGTPLQERVWSLEDRKGRAKGAAPIVKVCPECMEVIPIAPRTCPECSYEFPAPEPVALPKTRRGSLTEIKEVKLQDRRDEWQALHQVCVERGYKIGWAKHAYKRKFGKWPSSMVMQPEAKPTADEMLEANLWAMAKQKEIA